MSFSQRVLVTCSQIYWLAAGSSLKGRHLQVRQFWEKRPLVVAVSHLHLHFPLNNSDINLHPAGGGGGGVWTPPPRGFSRLARKRRFFTDLIPIFLATFVKVSILGHARSGHKVRSSDPTLQKLCNRAPVFEGTLWNFLNMIGSLVPTKCISWVFDICDLRSGHFRDLPIIIVNGQKLNSLFYALSWDFRVESHHIRYLLVL